MRTVFITGGTGYIGKRLISELLKDKSLEITALVRKGSEKKLPLGCRSVTGDALNALSYMSLIPPSSIFIHLVGVPHPSPSKKKQFRDVDLVSVKEAVKAAMEAGVVHFIYISVSMYPTGIMKSYREVRAEGEKLLSDSGIKSSFIRPWYVLGPGHWWPVLLKPFYLVAKMLPSTKAATKELDTVTIKQMIGTLTYAVQHQPVENTVYNISQIKTFTIKN